MDFRKKIKEDLKRAFKEKDVLKRSVLSMLRSSILNLEIERKRKALGENDIIEVISKEAKKRKEAISAYEKSGRGDLSSKEKKELEILEAYLPAKLSNKDLVKIIDEAVKEAGAQSEKDFGKVMGELMPKIKGRADGALVSVLVREKLSKLSK